MPDRPRQKWKAVVEKDLRRMGISWDDVEEAAEVRKSWRRGIVVSPNASLTRGLNQEPGTTGKHPAYVPEVFIRENWPNLE